MVQPRSRLPTSPVWLTHHDPAQFDRCAIVGPLRICRRCLLLYPVTFVTLVLASGWARALWVDLIIGIVVPIPAVAEFALEHLGRIAYRPAVQAAVTIPVGAALGVGFDRYLRDHTDPLWWTVVVVYGAVCLASVLVAARRDLGDPLGP
jgi:hypothetical protein